MTEARIDEEILSAVGERWTKVAMVLVRTAEALGLGLPNEDEQYETISDRVEALVKDGRLEAQGNTKNWRASEVRLAGAEKSNNSHSGEKRMAKSEERY